jgi:hypothetical protein
MIEALLIHRLALSTGRTSRTLKTTFKRLEHAPAIYFPPLDDIIGRRYFGNIAAPAFDDQMIEILSDQNKLGENAAFKQFDETDHLLIPEQRSRFTLCVHGPANCWCIYRGNGYAGIGGLCIRNPNGNWDYIVELIQHWIKTKLPVRED